MAEQHDYPACAIFRGGPHCTCVYQDPPDLLALAQRCGASVMYPTGELPRRPEVTFRPEAWRQFAAALGVMEGGDAQAR